MIDKPGDLAYSSGSRGVPSTTLYSIKRDRFEDAPAISEQLPGDNLDLIHKAVGWMVRKAGKRDLGVLEDFLKPRYQQMPRTTPLKYCLSPAARPK